MAKHVVQVADGKHHELSSHLGRTHLLVEVFLMAVAAQPRGEPPTVAALVAHFEGTVFINDSARTSLIAPGGAIDQIFAGTISSSQDFAVSALATVDIATYDLPTRTAARGTEAITQYPWRDDAMLVWTRRIGSSMRSCATCTPRPRTSSATGSSPHGPRRCRCRWARAGLKGFVGPTTHAELTRLITLVIYTASAHTRP